MNTTKNKRWYLQSNSIVKIVNTALKDTDKLTHGQKLGKTKKAIIKAFCEDIFVESKDDITDIADKKALEIAIQLGMNIAKQSLNMNKSFTLNDEFIPKLYGIGYHTKGIEKVFVAYEKLEGPDKGDAQGVYARFNEGEYECDIEMVGA